ncbi:hypothetical protein QBC34DRAFT_424580 [Podospora aff. communis PSN243]|uniref:F-box domain-containing protein n=1 Tax=Podospora aff. communis PSN243 TaxID=3040156 RepID=A0AAV9GQB6_9PEZI|nr:hypothetical protein QBC34DRAFT_424580 [Podospora aff. communis PSN243]
MERNNTALTKIHHKRSRLEALPEETFRELLRHMGVKDVVRLGSCSMNLRHRTQPVIFNDQDCRERALEWACENNLVHLFERAVEYGANISVIASRKNHRQLYEEYRDRDPYNNELIGWTLVDMGMNISAIIQSQGLDIKCPHVVPGMHVAEPRRLLLALAARHDDPTLFRRLISLGARLKNDENGYYSTMDYWALCDSLADPAKQSTHLEPFYRAGLVLKLPGQAHRRFWKSLWSKAALHRLQGGKQLPPANVLRQLMGTGSLVACRHQTWMIRLEGGDETIMSAMAAALLCDHKVMVDVMLLDGWTLQHRY